MVAMQTARHSLVVSWGSPGVDSEGRSRRQRAGGERRRGQCLRAVQSGNSSDLLESGPSAPLLLTKHTRTLMRLRLLGLSCASTQPLKKTSSACFWHKCSAANGRGNFQVCMGAKRHADGCQELHYLGLCISSVGRQQLICGCPAFFARAAPTEEGLPRFPTNQGVTRA